MTNFYQRCKIPSDVYVAWYFYLQVKLMLKGTVKSFDREKGWGFITVPNEGEIFVHYTGIEGHGLRVLTPGDQVSLVIVQGKRGPQAAHVQRINKRGL